MRTGTTVHALQLEVAVKEIYDVIVLPKVICPAAIGFKAPDIRHHISIDEVDK